MAINLATDPAAAGTPAAAPTKVTAEQAKQLAQLGQARASGLGQILGILVASPRHANAPIGYLRNHLLPAITLGQFATAVGQSNETGAVMPAAAVWWAWVSPAVLKKLSETPATLLALEPAEWRSGDQPFIIEAIGERRVVTEILARLSQTTFKDKPPMMRTFDKDGKPVTGRIEVRREDKAAS